MRSPPATETESSAISSKAAAIFAIIFLDISINGPMRAMKPSWKNGARLPPVFLMVIQTLTDTKWSSSSIFKPVFGAAILLTA